MTYQPMTGNELIARLQRGRRDFQGIKLVEGNLEIVPAYTTLKIMTQRNLGAGYGEGADFSKSDLTGLRAPGIVLRGAVFDDAILRNINLAHADLGYSSFKNARLAHVDFSRGAVACSMFEGAVLDDVDIAGNLFFEVGLSKSLVRRIRGIPEAKHVATGGIDDLVVDRETYQQMQDAFPHNFPLIARDSTLSII